MDMEKFELPARFKGETTNVWEEYKKLATIYKPIDLGQGYPDFPAPENITTALKQVAGRENVLMHQYTRGSGHMRLVNALSQLYTYLIGRAIDPENEILISVGAYGVLYSTIRGHIDNGDEVIIIEPFFDCYEPMVRTSGGIPIFIPLRPKERSETSSSADWVLDEKELEAAFNSKTKAIIINSPNNPLGKVYTEEELIFIANLCKRWNVLCISDEVYEWLVYAPNKHIRIATLPGMWERTITIGSAGKTFSVTGWKIGWAYGPHNLIHNLHIVHQNSIYTCNTPLQEALAIGFEMELKRLNQDTCSFTSLIPALVNKKNYMVRCLTEIGLKPIMPDGGYFILADCSHLASKVDLSSEPDKHLDVRFTKWLIKNVGVQLIPCSVFYGAAHKTIGEHLIRWCFIKEDAKLEAAIEKMQKWKDSLNK